ncbi:G-type lectin S-receptor-like serine/threonine-protein kinase RLK1 [Morella rubra]|uniref:non-specific serine/threonine protein kinase n=1 Tax=Morella rubra TaxID=262757 RepID=A0A6A1WDE7_9ROSI|nr:G-type lectin S-receptor-like serine/threonine-protein kinase RLK1 [Morella rubra]
MRVPIGFWCFEYMSQGTLADYLFKSKIKPNWEERIKIALNIARGIRYLHEECEIRIIHCDINPNNILMDEYGSPKISDFGLAKLLMSDHSRTVTGIRGTRGYVAPEWHKNLPITVKADVYSFGIVFLVIANEVPMLAPEEVEEQTLERMINRGFGASKRSQQSVLQ